MNLYKECRRIYHCLKKIPLISGVRFVKDLYNKWYWKERFVKGKTMNSLCPYIIRRYAQDMGIGSYIISNLSQIHYAISKGYVPVVDMKNYNFTKIDGENFNTWTVYFNQLQMDLAAAYCKQHYLSDGGSKDYTPNDSIEFLSDMKELVYWSSLFNRYVSFNDDMKHYTSQEMRKIFPTDCRILGVLCRGTDYLKLKPIGHPKQPTIESVISKAKTVMREYNCQYIYLATEDYNIEKTFRRVFGNKILVNKRVYKNYKEGYLANTLNERENDKYITNKEYLSSLYLLSNCDCLIAGRTSGTVITMLMNYDYEYKYFWDLGVYGNEK